MKQFLILGIPEPEVEWTKNGKLLLSSTNVKVSNINGHAKLEFIATHIEDSGKYMCTARNAFGIATSSAQLVVRRN